MAKKPYFLQWLNNFATDCLKENLMVEESRPAAIAPIAALFVNISFCHEDKMFRIKIDACKVIWHCSLSSRIDLS